MLSPPRISVKNQGRAVFGLSGLPNPPRTAEKAAKRGWAPLRSQDLPLFIFPALLGRHQNDRLKDVGRRRLLGGERQLQVTDDPVDDGVLREESVT